MDQEQQTPDGLKYINDLRNAGFNDDEIAQEQSKQSSDMSNAGFTAREIKDYWGTKDPDLSKLQKPIDQQAAVKPDESGQQPKREPIDASVKPVAAEGILDSLAAGFGNSFLGLALRGEKSPIENDQNAGVMQNLASAASGFIGDAPMTLAGMLGGAAIGGPLGAAAGSMAVPEAARKVIMDYYENGSFKDAKDVAHALAMAGLQGAKGAATGAAMFMSGGVAGAVAGKFGGAIAENIARVTAETASVATVQKALEGQLPSWKDFENAGVVIGGLHMMSAGLGQISPLTQKISNIYKKTGVRPEQVADTLEGDQALKGEMLSVNPDLPIEAAPEKQEEAPPSVAAEKPPETGAAPDTSLRDKILSAIGEKAQKKPLVQELKDDAVSYYAKRMDFTSTIKDAMKEVGNDPLSPENAHLNMRLHAASMDKLREFVEHGTRDFETGEVNGEGYKQIIDDINDQGPEAIKDFNALRIAMRKQWMRDKGMKVPKGSSAEEDAQFIKDNQENMQPFLDRYQGWRNRIVDYLADSGRLSKKSADSIKSADKGTYAPMKRILEPDPLTGKIGGSSSREIQRIQGSDKDLIDPFESDLRDAHNMIRLAHETEAQNLLVDQLTGHDDKLRLSENQKGPLGKAQIAGYQDGERTLYDTTPAIADSVKRLAGNKPVLNAWTRLLKIPATMLRLGTVDNPVFGVRHAERQQITASTLSKTGLKPFEAFAYAPEYLAGESKDFHNFIYDGAAVNNMVDVEDRYLQRMVYKFDQNHSFMDKAWNNIKTVGGFSHAAIMINDNMIRFAEYKRMLAKGAPRKTAAFAAREVIPDFQKAGLNKSAFQALTAFLDVHLQGQARAFQEARENPTEYIQKNLAYITAPSMVLALANRNDDAVKDVARWQRDNYWIIHPSDWRKAHTIAEYESEKNAYPSNARFNPDLGPEAGYEVNDGPLIRIQKPFTNGIVFGSLPEAALEAYQNKSPAAAEDLAQAAIKSIFPEALSAAATTFGTPIVEQWTNRNFYTNEPLIRHSMEDKLPEYRYKQYTSDTAKVIGKALSYMPLVRDFGPKDAKITSPEVIDNYMHAWGGTLGQYMVNLSDKALEAAGVTPKTVKPASTLYDIPFVKEFLIRYPMVRPQSVQDFEDRYQKADQVFNTIKMLQKQGDFDEAARVQDRYHINMDRLRGVDSMMMNMNGVIQKTYQNPDMKPDEKRQIIDQAYLGIVGWAKKGNELMDEFEKRGEK